jgi:uncharacterized membrane protein
MTSLVTDVKSFQCPNCSRYINDTMTSCKYCSSPLDVQTVSNAVENQDLINDAYNKANNIRILAGALITTFFLSLIPFIGILFAIAHYLTFFGVPILLAYWFIKFGSIKTTDPEFKSAKNFCWTALFIWLGYIAFAVILEILF